MKELNIDEIKEIQLDILDYFHKVCVENYIDYYLSSGTLLGAIKYDGYIKRQLKQVEQYKKMEKKRIPVDIDYDDVMSLRLEARQKLKQFQPVSVGQASRISGVSPADISVLLVYLEHFHSTAANQ